MSRSLPGVACKATRGTPHPVLPLRCLAKSTLGERDEDHNPAVSWEVKGCVPLVTETSRYPQARCGYPCPQGRVGRGSLKLRHLLDVIQRPCAIEERLGWAEPEVGEPTFVGEAS